MPRTYDPNVNTQLFCILTARDNKAHTCDMVSSKEAQTDTSLSSALVFLSPPKQTGAGNLECALALVPLKVRMRNSNRTVLTYAFLDPGSSATFLY